MKKFVATLLAFTFLFTLGGCATMGEWWTGRASVCDSVEGKSYLCETAEQVGIKVEDAGAIIIIANEVAIAEGLYTKDQFNEVIHFILDTLQYTGERDLPTFEQLRAKIKEALTKYPGLVTVVQKYMDMFLNESGVIPAADREIITNWLVKQLKK